VIGKKVKPQHFDAVMLPNKTKRINFTAAPNPLPPHALLLAFSDF
jgi:hypothetical protein